MHRATAIACLLATTSIAAGEDILGTSTITARDPSTGGLVEVTSTVYAIPGNVARFEYAVTNISYEPSPGETNGFSGLTLAWGVLPGPFADFGFAPPDWSVAVGFDDDFNMSADFQLPFGQGPGLGFGESALFGFETTDPGIGRLFSDTTVLVLPTGNSHDILGPAGSFALIDVDTGRGPLLPVPTPGSVAVFLSAAALGVARRRRGT